MISIEEQKKIENDFEQSLKELGITNYESKVALKYQLFYFRGVLSRLQELPPFWIVCITTGRSILVTRANQENNGEV